MVVGVVVGLVLALLDVWWGLIVGVFLAFLFGALLARPWCAGAGNGRPGESQAGLRSARRS